MKQLVATTTSSIALANAIQTASFGVFECKRDAQIIAQVMAENKSIRAIWRNADDDNKKGQVMQGLAATICKLAEMYFGKTENTDATLWLECAKFARDNHAGIGVDEIQLAFAYAAKNSSENTLWTKSFTVFFFGSLLEKYQLYRNKVAAQISRLQQEAELESKREEMEQTIRLRNEQARAELVAEFERGEWQCEADIPHIAVGILKSIGAFDCIDSEVKKTMWQDALKDTMLHFAHEITRAQKIGMDTTEMEKAANHKIVRYNVQIFHLAKQISIAPIEMQAELQDKLDKVKTELANCNLQLPKVVLQKATILFGKRLILNLISNRQNENSDEQ